VVLLAEAQAAAIFPIQTQVGGGPQGQGGGHEKNAVLLGSAYRKINPVGVVAERGM
jgi:hypothetical protein